MANSDGVAVNIEVFQTQADEQIPQVRLEFEQVHPLVDSQWVAAEVLAQWVAAQVDAYLDTKGMDVFTLDVATLTDYIAFKFHCLDRLSAQDGVIVKIHKAIDEALQVSAQIRCDEEIPLLEKVHVVDGVRLELHNRLQENTWFTEMLQFQLEHDVRDGVEIRQKIATAMKCQAVEALEINAQGSIFMANYVEAGYVDITYAGQSYRFE